MKKLIALAGIGIMGFALSPLTADAAKNCTDSSALTVGVTHTTEDAEWGTMVYLETGAKDGLQPGDRHELGGWGQAGYSHCPSADKDLLLW